MLLKILLSSMIRLNYQQIAIRRNQPRRNFPSWKRPTMSIFWYHPFATTWQDWQNGEGNLREDLSNLSSNADGVVVTVLWSIILEIDYQPHQQISKKMFHRLDQPDDKLNIVLTTNSVYAICSKYTMWSCPHKKISLCTYTLEKSFANKSTGYYAMFVMYNCNNIKI